MDNTAREQWLEERRQGIGGSDAPVVVLGEYYGKTVQDLYYDKVEGTADFLDPDKHPDIRRGNRQEPVAARVYEEISGEKVVEAEGILTHPDHSFMRASVDRLILPGKTPLEIKCPRHPTFLKWKREGIPQGPILQGQHYCAVTGSDQIIYAVFCAEIDELMVVPINADQGLIDLVIDKESAFWQYVEAHEGPPPYAPAEVLDLPPVGGELVLLDTPEWRTAAHSFQQARTLRKEAEELEESAKLELQEIMGDDTIVEGGGLRVYWKQQAGRKTFDKKALARAHPEIDLSNYEKEGKSFKSFRPYVVGGE